MELYSENESYKLYKGNMLDVLEVLKPNSVDSIVTDPPYGLTSITQRFGKEGSAPAQFGKDGAFSRLSKGFMGKEWDGSGIEYNVNAWSKLYNVLKPGGYMLVFGGSRTFYRIACAIEDAGFEIRDTIMWLYGCLSNDTEILTSNGWKTSETITTDDYIYSLDLQKDIIIKNKCLNVFKYDYDGEMVSLKNGNTNQLLTPNHHCIVKDKIKTQIKGQTNYNTHNYWNYKDAWQIRSQTVQLPLASNYDGKLEIGNLFAELLGWVISEGTYLKDTNAIMITQSSVNQKYVERIRYILGKLHIEYNEYSREREYKNKKYIEYDFYISKKAEETVNKIKELAPNKKLNWNLLELSLSNKEFLIKGLLYGDGAKSNNTLGFNAFYQKDIEQLQVFQALLHLTGRQGWINEKKNSCSIHNNSTTELQGKHFKNRFVKYDGKYVWCIETEIGNFIAKRGGKIFITGNSGFPKGLNLGKGVETKLETGSSCTQNQRKLSMGSKYQPTGQVNSKNGLMFKSLEDDEYLKNDNYIELTHEESKMWDGWNTSLKPAFEPIIMAKKPTDGNIVDNVLAYGVGGINIDECRVGNDTFGGGTMHEFSEEHIGRFPSNVILSYDEETYDEVCSGFPNTKGGGKTKEKGTFGYCFSDKRDSKPMADGYDDEGSASRYFYCAKASKKDRDEGLDGFEEKQKYNCDNSWNSLEIFGTTDGGRGPLKNIHPTVKPTTLMQYLIRLVTPNGGTILDPFNGSGSTGKAAMYENKERNKDYKYVGIELDGEYLSIAKARIEYAITNEICDISGINPNGISNKKVITKKQRSLF